MPAFGGENKGGDVTRLFVFSHPRTASNLWKRLLEAHPALDCDSDTPFIHAFKYGPERMQLRDQGPDAENRFKEHSHETFQYCYDKMLALVAKAEKEGKLPMVKEHTYHILDARVVARNLDEVVKNRILGSEKSVGLGETELKRPLVPNGKIVGAAGDSADDETSCPFLVPRSFMDGVTPVITIRHPARYILSYLRAGQSSGVKVDDVDFPVNAYGMRWQKIVYDYFASGLCGNDSTHPQYPVVVDADDLCNNTEEVMRKFCERVGIDSSGVKYEWDALPDEQKKRMRTADQHFLGTLLGSSGVIKTSSGELDLREEEEKWAANWDSDTASRLRRYCEAAMEDYEHLRLRRI